MTYSDSPSSAAHGAAGATRDWLFEARAALEAGDQQHAIYAAREALATNGNSAEAWSIRSRASFILEHFEDAAFEAREAVRLAPNVAQGHLDLGSALEVLSSYDEALREFEEAARLDPSEWRARAGAGSVYIRSGRPDEAISVFEQLHAEGPDREVVRFFLAQALVDDGEARMTSIPGGWTITSPQQAEIAEDRARRAAALKPPDQDGLGESIEQLRTLAAQAPQPVWRRSDHIRAYFIVAFVGLAVGLLGLGSVQTLLYSLLGWALLAGMIWLYVRRHHKPRWQWAAQDVGHR